MVAILRRSTCRSASVGPCLKACCFLTIFGGAAQAAPFPLSDETSTATNRLVGAPLSGLALRRRTAGHHHHHQQQQQKQQPEEDDQHYSSSVQQQHRQLTFSQITHTTCTLSTEVPLDILFKTDLNAEETTEVFLMDDVGFRHSIWVGDELNPLEELAIGMCIDSSTCYRLVVEDSGGDGLCCAYGLGGYQVQYNHETVALSGVDNFEEAVIVLGDQHCEQVYNVTR